MAKLTDQQYLDALEEVLQKIALGEQVQTVGYDGQNVTYTATDEMKVRGEIARIKKKLGQPTGRQARRAFF